MASVNVTTARQRIRLEGNSPGQKLFVTYRVATLPGGAVISTPRQAYELLDVRPGDAYSSLPDMRAVRPVITELVEAGELRAYDIEWEYEQFAQFPQSPDDGGDLPLQQRIRKTSSLQWVDAWRRPINAGELPAPGVPDLATTFQMYGNAPISKDGSATGDIQGVPIDSNGEATSIAVYIQKIDITQEANNSSQEQEFDEVVGTRNDSVFLGREVGSVLYTGHDLSKDDGNIWQYVHHFIVDSDLHARDSPYRVPETGKAKIGATSLTGTQLGYIGFAYPVYWIQPYPIRSSFNLFV